MEGGFTLALEGDNNETNEDVDHEESQNDDVDHVEVEHVFPVAKFRTFILSIGVY